MKTEFKTGLTIYNVPEVGYLNNSMCPISLLFSGIRCVRIFHREFIVMPDKSKSYHNEFYALGREIFVYQLPDNKRGNWYCRFLNPIGGSRYIRRSLRTADKTIATKRAIDLYNELQTRHRRGNTAYVTDWNELIEELAPELTEHRRAKLHSLNRLYWSGFFGEENHIKDIFYICDADMIAYWKYRLDYWKDKQDIRPPSRTDGIKITRMTIVDERTLLKWVLRRAFERRYICNRPLMPKTQAIIAHSEVVDLPRHLRRGKFEDEYKAKIVPQLRLIRKALEAPSWREAPEQYQFIMRSRDRYAQACIYAYLLTISNTGLRPSELRQMRWSDLSVFTDEDGKKYTKLVVRREVSKVRKYRDVYSRDFLATYDRLMFFRNEWIRYWGEENFKPERLMFPKAVAMNEDKKRIYPDDDRNFARSIWENVASFHDRAGCHIKKIEGNDVFFTAYSYRSYAISQRLKSGLDIYVASKLYGTSIKHLCDTYDYNLNEHFVSQITAHTKAEYQRFDFRGSSPEKVELKIATDADAPTIVEDVEDYEDTSDDISLDEWLL